MAATSAKTLLAGHFARASIRSRGLRVDSEINCYECGAIRIARGMLRTFGATR